MDKTSNKKSPIGTEWKTQDEWKESRFKDFTLKMNPERLKALVDLETLQRLVGMLHQASIDTIIDGFTKELSKVKTLDEYLDMLNGEIAFHGTIKEMKSQMDEEQKLHP